MGESEVHTLWQVGTKMPVLGCASGLYTHVFRSPLFTRGDLGGLRLASCIRTMGGCGYSTRCGEMLSFLMRCIFRLVYLPIAIFYGVHTHPMCQSRAIHIMISAGVIHGQLIGMGVNASCPRTKYVARGHYFDPQMFPWRIYTWLLS